MLKLLEVSFSHPIKLIANALGVPPQSMLEMGRTHSVPVAALIGAKEHAVRQVKVGVDIIIAEGWEAGGHCSEVSTLVLIPEVLRAIKPIREAPSGGRWNRDRPPDGGVYGARCGRGMD